MDLVTAPAGMAFLLLKIISGTEDWPISVTFPSIFVHNINRDLFNFEGNYLVLSAVTTL